MAITIVPLITVSNPGPVYSGKMYTFSADNSGVIFHVRFRIRLPLSRNRWAISTVYSSPSTPLIMILLCFKKWESQELINEKYEIVT
jgi:hypothetical protein